MQPRLDTLSIAGQSPDGFRELLMRQARDVIIESGNRTREGQGDRDWEIFARYLGGDSLEYICASCTWLYTIASVEKALERIIRTLRRNVERATSAEDTIIISPGTPDSWRNRDKRMGRNFDPQSYYREWYEKNKERRRAEMREYARAKRARQREDRLQAAQSAPSEDIETASGNQTS